MSTFGRAALVAGRELRAERRPPDGLVAALTFTAVGGNREAFAPAALAGTPFPGAVRVGTAMRGLVPEAEPSRIQDPFRRNLLYDLNEVAALEGLKMEPENFTRLQLVQAQLLRHWGDRP